ncbi:sensor histidine kinase [Calothrix sp. UHCC 0171]|uniref:sensor histidine kinase n=1 Tax=Calothrix sp. UHCC 0171 TaxID=3110245 RepID=UPI002B1E994B|nr:sensor histidine kinase [Calothrix sp. UHCC 0171]MEA5569843.1 sensor histidine kinase [Calothrix sp. UHCC 0171]
MSRPIQFNNHPFRFLLYLEWILLAIAAISAIVPYPISRYSNYTGYPGLTIFSLMIFTILGLRLPTNKQFHKILYTALQVILIVVIALFWGKPARIFPVIFLIFVIRSCLIFELPGRLVVTSISFSLFLLTLRIRFYHSPIPAIVNERFRFFGLNLSILFLLTLIFTLLLMNAVLSERQSREKLAAANKKLREYALRIENQATLEERNRLAREIHDSLGHSLTALNLQLETGLKLWQANPTKAEGFLTRAKELGSKALQDVRESVSTMRSHPWQGESLEQAIITLLEDLEHTIGVKPTYNINFSEQLSSEISVAVYRIIQESLTNISKYANPPEVKLEILTSPTELYLQIQDTGIGFDLNQNTTGFGLQSMRDRTEALGGKFNIETTPGEGCKIQVNIPIYHF